MKCGGRGVCGCGRLSCAENLWWFQFATVWGFIAMDMLEQRIERWTEEV